jgi:hypothetical protein
MLSRGAAPDRIVRRCATIAAIVAGCAAPPVAADPPQRELPDVDVTLIEDLRWDRSLEEIQHALMTAEPRLEIQADDAEAQRRGEDQWRGLHVRARGWFAHLYFMDRNRGVAEVDIYGWADSRAAAAAVARLARRFPDAKPRRTYESGWSTPGGVLTVRVAQTNRGSGEDWFVLERLENAETFKRIERLTPLAVGADPEAALASFNPRLGPPTSSKRTWHVYDEERWVDLFVQTDTWRGKDSWFEHMGRMAPRPSR